MKRLELVGVEGIGEVRAGDSLGELISAACARQQIELADRDVLIVAQKIVSKAEGRMLQLADMKASPRAKELAAELDKQPELVEAILRESRSVIRTGGRALAAAVEGSFHRIQFMLLDDLPIGKIVLRLGVCGPKACSICLLSRAVRGISINSTCEPHFFELLRPLLAAQVRWRTGSKLIWTVEQVGSQFGNPRREG